MENALPEAPPANFNFAAHLLAVNAGRAQRTAYIDDHERITYGELDDRVRRMAVLLREHAGLQQEDRVLLVMQDSIDWVVSFLGAIYAGVVPVAVNTLLTPGDYAYMLDNSRAKAILASDELMPRLRTAIEQQEASCVREFLVSSRAETGSGGEPAIGHLLATLTPAQAHAPTAADEPAFWLYSSGSTGRPKGAVHTHANPYWTAELYAKPVLAMTEDDIAFSAAKLFFAYGLGNALTFPLSVGASVVLMAERPTPDACFQRMKQQRPTLFFGAPTGYAGMLASPALPVRSEVALRLCSSAGEALPQDIGTRFTRHFGCEIIDGIGSTEMLHIFLSNRAGDVRYGTTGKPVEGYEVELRDEQGRPVPVGEIGDLYIRGPSSALMYWNNRVKSRETFQGDWTRSGDKYLCDADGYYTYCGRSDDMLKVSGQYVSPFEVEATLVRHPSVLEAAVVGIADADGLIRCKAYVVLRPGHTGGDELADELKRFVKGELAPHKYPRLLEFIDELPKTATGKIQRFRLREQGAGVAA